MKAKKLPILKEARLNKIPEFYESTGGVYIDRIGYKEKSNSSFLKIVKVVDVSGKTDLMVTEVAPGIFTYDTTFEHTVKHNLGDYPYIFGQLLLGDDNFPIPFGGEPGIEQITTYKNVTKNEFTVSISSSVITEVLDVTMKLYLLRESIS